jgi:hypothetical protein
MAVTALATLVAVSTDARPGDVLYGLKRGTEQTQLALAGDARGQTLLDFAATRLDELEDLVADGPSAMSSTPAGPAEGTVLAAGADPALLLETLRTMDDQTTQGAAWLTRRAVSTEDADPLGDLAVWAEEQSAGLAALAPRFPGETAEAGQASLGLLADVTTRVTGLRAAIECAGGPAVNGADALGPVPGLCMPEQGAAPPVGSGTTPPTAPVPGGPPTPGTPPTTTDTVPQPPAGSDGSSEGSGSAGGGGSGPGGVELPTTDLPPPPGPLPELPPLPTIPGAETGGGTPSGPVLEVPSAPVTLCLPPLATIGDC